ncbi:MAG: hydroxyectoine utilization dehydratase EutB [SAR324 cluster bacterium]|jgi:threonine dehydratase|nr:hydroxyectoine utilization dehydratase EutB [SAR324 cluster bacterium]|tara:strand:- start:243 stop:1205 length:963 start_codon:yes stop_codon:yes gene_type:complete
MNIPPLEIYQAKKRISPYVTRTPLVRAHALSNRCEAEIWCKLETMQPTGAFKLRGATNAILRLNEDQRKRGVVAVSTGNHGRGVAYAAREQGVRAVICLSSLVPENKVEAIKSLGADVRIVGNSQDEAEIEANRLTEEEGLIPISPFDHPDVIAGQGTIGLELLEDFPKLNCVVVPLSGGGLIGGIALALKAASPKINVVGVTMENGPAMVLSLEAGKPVEVEEEESLADSLGGGIGLENRYTLSLVQELVDETLLVSEDEIGQAIQYVFETQRMVLEGGAAVGPAALLAKKLEVQGQNVALIYSGNNIAEKTLRKVLDS